MRGQLNLIILSTLKDENKYVLQIIKDIKDKTGGKIELKLPSLYSSLKRLEQSGYISSYWEKSEIGGNRRYSSITEKGIAYLEDNTESWDLSQSAVAEVLNVKSNALNKNNNELSIQPDFFGIIDDEKTIHNEALNKTNNTTTPSQFNSELDNYTNDTNHSNENLNINPSSFLFNKNDSNKNDLNQSTLDDIDYASIFSDILQDDNKNDNINQNYTYIEQQNYQNANRINEVFNLTNNTMHFGKSQSAIDKYLVKDKNPIDDKYKINILHKKKFENEVQEEKTEPIMQMQVQAEEALSPLELLNDNNMSLKKYLQNLTENGIKFSIYNESIKSSKNNKSDFVAINKIQLTTSIFSALLIIMQLVASFAIFNAYNIHNDNLVYILSLCLVLFYILISAIVFGINPNLKRKRKELKPQLKIRIFIMLSLWLIIFAVNLFCGMRVIAILKSLVYIVVPMLLALNILIDYLIRQIILANSK